MSTPSAISDRILLTNNGLTEEKHRGDAKLLVNTTIQSVILITICTIGLVANSCAFLVIVKSNIIKVSTGIYLAFLSVFDNLTLVIHLLETFLNVSKISSFACKLIKVVRLSALTISCNILVTMTVERCYIITNPYKPNPTRKQAATIATVSVFVITLVNSVLIGTISGLTTPSVGTNLDKMSSFNNASKDRIFPPDFGTKTVCTFLPQYEDFYRKVFGLTIFLTKLVSPLIVLLCNLIIISYLRKKNTVVPLNSVSGMNQDKRITKMLIIVSLSFSMFVLPQGFYLALGQFFYEHISEAVANDNPAWQTVSCWYLLNHSLNFFQYILSGKKFREESKNAFKSIINIFRRN